MAILHPGFHAVADTRETVIEFHLDPHDPESDYFRLIIRSGYSGFALERLIRDQHRHWISRWEQFGRGTHRRGEIRRHQLHGDVATCPLPVGLRERVRQAIAFEATGEVPLQSREAMMRH